MNHRTRVLAAFAALLLSLLGGATVRAADTDASVQQMTKLNAAALDDYSAGDFDKAKSRLLQAVAIGKKDPALQNHPLMATTFLHLGALYVDGFEDSKTGISYFTKAFQIQPDIEMTESLQTKTVTSALAEAKKQTGASPGSAPTTAQTRATQPTGTPVAPAGPTAAEKEKLDKARAEAKALTLQLQSDRAEKEKLEKQALADREKSQKELALVRDSEAKERAAKEKLAAEKQSTDKALADAKLQLQQLQKDKADKEKQLADTAAREKKEREAKEKLLAEKQAGEAREKARLAQEEATRARREKLAAGPDLPAHFTEPVYCNIPDEVEVGTEIYVHCAAKPGLGARTIELYYRSSNGMHYNSVELEPGKKGWQTTVIPASKVTGRALQYYVEAHDTQGGIAAANGKAGSPNILALRPAGGGSMSMKNASFVKKR